jgi:hypothetical protein
MSTRANIVITDGEESLWFYKHSDGYPEGVMPILQKLLQWVNDDILRDNASQMSGWLILLGVLEYNNDTSCFERPFDINTFTPSKWKVGAYEPTGGRHGDIAYLYTLDLSKRLISMQKV